jgi:predicted SprT family Zn-dependent metalloprotease
MNSLARPTKQTYDELQLAYDWFNQHLFAGALPSCLITLQRNKRTMGYFSKERFVDHGGLKTDEIAMNPEYFAVQTVEDVLSTLVHEMVHLWQEHFGKPGRGKYHNQQWADKMIAIGLCPSDTGKTGGKQTGDQVDHYIVKSGKFLASCKALLDTDFKISWYDRYPAWLPAAPPSTFTAADDVHVVVGGLGEFDKDISDSYQAVNEIPALASPYLELVSRAPDNSNRTKYRCAVCEIQAWGKPNLNLVCGDCHTAMVAVA